MGSIQKVICATSCRASQNTPSTASKNYCPGMLLQNHLQLPPAQLSNEAPSILQRYPTAKDNASNMRLVLRAEGSELRPESSYYFLSAAAPDKRSKFGWVKCSDRPFTSEALIAEHPKIDKSREQCELLAELLLAIAKLPEGTPVAGSYFRRGVEHPRIELSFHKVFLYHESRRDAVPPNS